MQTLQPSGGQYCPKFIPYFFLAVIAENVVNVAKNYRPNTYHY